MYVTGEPDKEPLCTGGEPAEYFAGLTAWVAILAAVEHRAQTGQGQHIDVSMLESLGTADEYNTVMYAGFGAVRKRYYSRHHFSAYPSDIFPCKDGHIVVVGGAGGFPTAMALLLEKPELESNPLFRNPWARFINWRQFEELILPYLLEHEGEDLLKRAQELRMPFAAVLDPQMLLENAHLKERRFFQEVDHPEIGRLPLPGAPFRMFAGSEFASPGSDSPSANMRMGRAPMLGEHTQEVLLKLGYEKGDTVILRERGIT
jgi:crotonobetainyl-CoA:carnitine CoA-transferase CaiB-like acyl-CoA transferase